MPIDHDAICSRRVESRTCIGRGTGTELEPLDSDLAGTPVLLVNPRVPLATGPVYAGWDGMDRGPLSEGPASRIAREGRNDLETAAISLCPEIAEVLSALRQSRAQLVRPARPPFIDSTTARVQNPVRAQNWQPVPSHLEQTFIGSACRISPARYFFRSKTTASASESGCHCSRPRLWTGRYRCCDSRSRRLRNLS